MNKIVDYAKEEVSLMIGGKSYMMDDLLIDHGLTREVIKEKVKEFAKEKSVIIEQAEYNNFLYMCDLVFLLVKKLRKRKFNY